MAQLLVFIVVLVVSTFVGYMPLGAQSLSMSVSNSEPDEYGRTYLQCQAAVSDDQVVAISKDNQPIAWDGDLLPRPDSSRFTLMLEEHPHGARGSTISLLTIQPVCKQDRGNYSCAVYERDGSNYNVVQSLAAEVSSVVDYDSSDMCSPVGPGTVLAGESVDFTCTSRSVSPVWSLEDEAVVESRFTSNPMRDTYSEGIRVTFSEDHQGLMFNCTASLNNCGSSGVSTKECTVGPITVSSEPQVIVSIRPTPVVPGDTAEFLCIVLPSIPTHTFKPNWHTIPSLEVDRAYYSFSGPSRMLLTVGEEDQGLTVNCTVDFQGRTVSGSAELVISTEDPGPNKVDPTVSTAETPSKTTPKSPGNPFLIFDSYPATIGIISGGSILIALLLALIVFCCCRKCKRRRHEKQTASRQPLRISPSTFGGPTPGHEVPGSGTDGMYMYATIFDPDEKWGATPKSTPTKGATDSQGYQQPMSGATTPPVYSQVGSPNFDAETNLDATSPIRAMHVPTPDTMLDNAFYQASGEYVNPESSNQQHINREMATIRLEKNLTALPTSRETPASITTPGYLAIGEVPDSVRAGNSNAKNREPVTYMEICN